MNAKQAILQAMLVDASCQTVVEVKEAPEGPMYAAFMQYGCSLEQFTKFVNAAIATGKITRRGHVLVAA